MSNDNYPNIALVGKSGVGKTTVAAYLVSEYGYVRTSTGDVCRQVCQLLFRASSKSLMNRVTDAMKQIDENVWLSTALAAVTDGQRIVFDSMRFQTDYDYLSDRGFSIWRVNAQLDVRIRRLSSRGEEFDPAADEIHRTETELDDVVANFEIDNSPVSLSNSKQRIDDRLRR